MIRLTGIVCCPLMALIGVLGAPSTSATEVRLLSSSQAKLQESFLPQSKRPSDDEEYSLKEVVPMRYHKHLKRSSDLQGLADSGASPYIRSG